LSNGDAQNVKYGLYTAIIYTLLISVNARHSNLGIIISDKTVRRTQPWIELRNI